MSYLETLEKKRNVANDFRTGTAMFAGISAGMVAVAGVMGGAAAVSTDIGLNHLTSEVREMGSYMEERNKLIDAFSIGQISEAEYKDGLSKLDSMESVVAYGKTSTETRVVALADSVESTDEMAETLIKKGVPRMSAVMLAPGAVAYTVSEAIKRKYDRLLREAKAQENEGL